MHFLVISFTVKPSLDFDVFPIMHCAEEFAVLCNEMHIGTLLSLYKRTQQNCACSTMSLHSHLWSPKGHLSMALLSSSSGLWDGNNGHIKWESTTTVSLFSLPTCQLQQLGQWFSASKFDAVVTPRVSFLEDPFLCSSINSKPESGTGWVGHQALPLEAGFHVLFVTKRQEWFLYNWWNTS